MSHPTEYKAYAITKAHGDLEPITVQWKDPEAGEIVVKVLACGVCAGDEIVKDQPYPTGLPRVPGHEIIGDVAVVPPSEKTWKVGDRVGAAWHGGHCFTCDECKAGKFNLCNKHTINGVIKDGGFAQYVTLRTECVINVPKDIKPEEAAPLVCAGVTTFNSLRNVPISPGDTVAVQGIGGLGHLGIQFSDKMGYKTIALSSTAAKKDISLELGASEYLDGSQVDLVAELNKLGGANVIMCCSPDAKSISSLVGALKPDGTLLLLAGTKDPLQFPSIPLLQKRLTIRGWPSGCPKDCEETIRFVQQKGIKVMVKTFPLDKAQEAYDHRSSARFRAVIVP